MVTSIQQAINAYRSAANQVDDVFTHQQSAIKPPSIGGALSPEQTPEQAQGTFLSMVKGYLQKSIDKNIEAEELSIMAVRGEADLTEVITAVANAEAALRTVVTVRDRVIRSYEEIIRMPV